MIKQIDRTNLKLLREQINQALVQVGNRHGIKLTAGNASFSDFNAAFKLEVQTIQDGNVISKDAQTFLDYAQLLGLSKDMLNQEFETMGRVYKLTGYKPRSTKYPFIAERDGKSYKLPSYAVKAEYFKNSLTNA